MPDYVIPGEPVPKGSFRVITSKASGKAMLIPQLSSAQKRWSRAAKLAIAPLERPLDEAVMVTALFVLARPKSVPEKKRPLHTVAPDVDKLARQVLDALTGPVLRDDCVVVSLSAGKRYVRGDEEPHTEVHVAPIGEWVGGTEA